MVKGLFENLKKFWRYRRNTWRCQKKEPSILSIGFHISGRDFLSLNLILPRCLQIFFIWLNYYT